VAPFEQRHLGGGITIRAIAERKHGSRRRHEQCGAVQRRGTRVRGRPDDRDLGGPGKHRLGDS
jgi:hypothetical protein